MATRPMGVVKWKRRSIPASVRGVSFCRKPSQINRTTSDSDNSSLVPSGAVSMDVEKSMDTEGAAGAVIIRGAHCTHHHAIGIVRRREDQ